MADYPKYIAEIIPSDLLDEMTDNRKESITDFGIAMMGALNNSDIASQGYDNVFDSYVFSTAESFWAYLDRVGRAKGANTGIASPATLVATTLNVGNGSVSATAGHKFYPRTVSGSMTVPGVATIVISTGVVDDPIKYIPIHFAEATGGNFVVNFDGNPSCIGSGSVSVSFYADSETSGGKGWAAVYGAEVSL